MSAPLKAIDGSADLPDLMTELAARARAAARVLALASPDQKNEALRAMERAIRANAATILAANAEDVAEVRAGGASAAFIDRLTLTQARIDAMADGIATGREIADPIGVVTASWPRPNGMVIQPARDPRLPGAGPARGRSARGLDHAGADPRPCRGRPVADRPERRRRCDRAARRQEPGRPRRSRSARAGVRAPGGRQPRLCRSCRQS